MRYPGDGGQEVLGVGVGGGGEEGVGGAVFDDGTLAHDGDVVGDVADDGEVVRDEDHGEIQIAREVGEEVEDLRLDGDVEGGDGFVGNDEFGLGGKGPGDGDALALAAGEFMRVFLHVAGVKADFFHEGCDGVAELGFAEGTALADGFGKGGVDGVARVEGGVGILEDHLEVEPPLADGFVGRAVRFSPWRMTAPAVGRWSCMMVRERVDLPQPDSPTRPRISPCSTARLTPLTAQTGGAALPVRKFFLPGKRTWMSCTSRKDMAAGTRGREGTEGG